MTRLQGRFPSMYIVKKDEPNIAKATGIPSNIKPNNINDSDTVTKQIWSGMYIQSLEQSPGTNEIIGEIINESLENRILTYHTAFLTLEPGMEAEIPDDDEFNQNPDDIWEAVGMEDNSVPVNYLSVSAYPNPFASSVTFEIQIPEEVSDKKASLKIYNLSGQLIRIIDLAEYKDKARIQITWDGLDDSGNEIEQGVYMVRLVSEDLSKTLRIVKIR